MLAEGTAHTAPSDRHATAVLTELAQVFAAACRTPMVAETAGPVIVADVAIDRRTRSLDVPNGVRFYAAVPVRDDDGRTVGCASVADTAPRADGADVVRALWAFAAVAEAEAAPRRLRAAADGAAAHRDELIALVSHELRTPVTVIVGLLEVLADGFLESDDGLRARFLEPIDRNLTRLCRTVDHLLITAGARSGGPTVAGNIVDLVELVRRRAAAHPAGSTRPASGWD